MPEHQDKLCKWDKERREKDFDKLVQTVTPPRFICKKCGRVANSEEWLHEPVALDRG